MRPLAFVVVVVAVVAAEVVFEFDDDAKVDFVRVEDEEHRVLPGADNITIGEYGCGDPPSISHPPSLGDYVFAALSSRTTRRRGAARQHAEMVDFVYSPDAPDCVNVVYWAGRGRADDAFVGLACYENDTDAWFSDADDTFYLPVPTTCVWTTPPGEARSRCTTYVGSTHGMFVLHVVHDIAERAGTITSESLTIAADSPAVRYRAALASGEVLRVDGNYPRLRSILSPAVAAKV